jgi:hypothetical protein
VPRLSLPTGSDVAVDRAVDAVLGCASLCDGIERAGIQSRSPPDFVPAGAKVKFSFEPIRACSDPFTTGGLQYPVSRQRHQALFSLGALLALVACFGQRLVFYRL